MVNINNIPNSYGNNGAKHLNFTTFINSTGTIGTIYTSAVTNITGSEFLALLGIIILIILFFLMFGLPIEVTSILIMPMIIVYGVYSQDLIGLLGLTLIYLGILFGKNFFIT